MELREKFELLLDMYRKPDGTKWTGADFHRATEGYLNRGYISNFRKGRIGQPRHDKLRTIANLMEFEPQLWFQEPEQWPDSSGRVDQIRSCGQTIRDRLNHLFELIHNDATGEPFSEQEVADRSRGLLSEADVFAFREGKEDDPTIGQIQALSEVFGVDQSYWFVEHNSPLVIDSSVTKALADHETRQFLTQTLRYLSAEDKAMLFKVGEKIAGNSNAGEKLKT